MKPRLYISAEECWQEEKADIYLRQSEVLLHVLNIIVGVLVLAIVITFIYAGIF